MDVSCDLICPGDLVSAMHGNVEYRPTDCLCQVFKYTDSKDNADVILYLISIFNCNQILISLRLNINPHKASFTVLPVTTGQQHVM